MKILVVCQYYYPEPFRITDICEALVNKGHNVTVLTGLPNYPEGKVLEDYRQGKRRKEVINGVRVIRSSILGRGNSKVTLFLNYVSFVISASLQVMLMKEKFDVVFVNQLSPVLMAIPAILYKKIHKRKILLYCLDLWPASLAAGGLTEKSIVYKIFLNISRWIYTSVDQILVTSKMFFHYFDEILKIDLNNIKHLPQYAEEDIFGKNVKAQSAKSDLFKFNFVFAGNIGDLQSVDTIVKAANELKSHQHIVLHIVGDGSKLSWCKQLSEELNLNNVFFH